MRTVATGLGANLINMLFAVFQVFYWHAFVFSNGYSFQVVWLFPKYFTIFIKGLSSQSEGFDCRETSHKLTVSTKTNTEPCVEQSLT